MSRSFESMSMVEIANTVKPSQLVLAVLQDMSTFPPEPVNGREEELEYMFIRYMIALHRRDHADDWKWINDHAPRMTVDGAAGLIVDSIARNYQKLFGMLVRGEYRKLTGDAGPIGMNSDAGSYRIADDKKIARLLVTGGL